MQNNIVCTGVGGQGVLTLGMVLAEAAAFQNRFVSYMPEYGGEMRGGSAVCKVKIGEEPIDNPFLEEENVLVVLHSKGHEAFLDSLTDGGCILAEAIFADAIEGKDGCERILVPATKLAEELGNPRGVSIAMAGAVIAKTGILSEEAALEAVDAYFTHKGLPVELNRKTFEAGYHFVTGQA